MFSGIIEQTGTILDRSEGPGGCRLRIDTRRLGHGPRAGDSVAIDGVCLTVVDPAAGHCDFDVIPETLRRTTLGERHPGDAVNLEAAMPGSGRFDGHFVQGHVDAVGTVTDIATLEADHILWVAHEPHLQPLIVPKGSVTIGGVSLTIADTRSGAFAVALIPTTLELTTLGRLTVGQRVNIETDILARTIYHQLQILMAAGGLPSGAVR